MSTMTERVGLDRVMYVRYSHADIQATHKFMLDFGLVAVKETAEKIWYQGLGEDPVCYISEQLKDGKASFLGGGWAVRSYADLETAARIPGATSITDCEEPIGGKMVYLQDPVGVRMAVHWGYGKRSKEQIDKPKPLVYNTWDKKRRLGEFQRLPDGPSHIYKLGHYGFEVNRAIFDTIRGWYLGHFTLAPSDTIFEPGSGNDVMVFAHIDKGEEFTDHHSFFLSAGDVESGYESHHSSFEVDDFDSELKGHTWLQKRGWELVWGIGRHLLGSQVFDYWYDTDSFVVEHYADGDLVNCNNVPGHTPATPENISIWGPDLPLSFLTRKAEDKGKILRINASSYQ